MKRQSGKPKRRFGVSRLATCRQSPRNTPLRTSAGSPSTSPRSQRPCPSRTFASATSAANPRHRGLDEDQIGQIVQDRYHREPSDDNPLDPLRFCAPRQRRKRKRQHDGEKDDGEMRQTERLKVRSLVHGNKQKFQNPSSNIQRNPNIEVRARLSLSSFQAEPRNPVAKSLAYYAGSFDSALLRSG